MKKILGVLLALSALSPSGFGQDDERRPGAIGISFTLTDFITADRIRTTSLSSVLSNDQWAKISEMTPGIAITYFKGITKRIDFAGTLAGSFIKYPFPKHEPFFNDRFLLAADASANLKLVTEKYWVQPYVSIGVGGHMYGGSYFGAFIPAGLGFKINFFDDAHFFLTSTYRVPVTTGTANYHFFHQLGIAGRIEEKKQKIIVPPRPPVDTDKDGIIDSLDKCPTVPGLPKYQGCPVPDTDKDGLNDEEDKCPTVFGLARYQGCPIPDTDKDGINDEEDKCPTVPGLARYQGCPPVDTDNDGIVDEEDKCPNRPGPKENFGCPVIGIKSYEIIFKVGSAILLPKGKLILDTVVAYLKRNPDVSVTIDGHTDITGGDKINLPLSKRRAESTKTYLVKQGIDAGRMTTAGYGSSQPVADNKTAKGRSLNRRIEIRIK